MIAALSIAILCRFGLIDISLEPLEPWQGQLDVAALYIMTDGITEATRSGAELEMDGLVEIVKTHKGMRGLNVWLILCAGLIRVSLKPMMMQP